MSVEVGVIWACWDTAAVGFVAAVALGPIEDSDDVEPVVEACDSECDAGATTDGGGGG